MPFDAIVHAPELRVGARVNIAQTDQTLENPPERLGVGAQVNLRFGVCCPDRAQGTIVEHSPDPEIAMLAVGARVWPLRKGRGGVATNGLLSEHWYVGET